MESTTNIYFTPVQQEVSQENGDGPDYSYSSKSKALIISSVALFAIAIVGVAVLALSSGAVLGVGAVLLSALAISVGIAGGVFTALGAVAYHTNEIAERELTFAKKSDNFDLQLKAYSNAAEGGQIDAIKWEHSTGKKIMLEALDEKDKVEKNLKFEKGLEIFENSAEHAIYHSYGRVKTYLNTHSELRDQIKKEFEETDSKTTFEGRAENYWSHVVDNARNEGSLIYSVIWRPTKF